MRKIYDITQRSEKTFGMAGVTCYNLVKEAECNEKVTVVTAAYGSAAVAHSTVLVCVCVCVCV